MGISYSSSRTHPRPFAAAAAAAAACQPQSPRLPPELIVLILEHAYATAAVPTAAYRAGLRAAALVCRSWRNPAQQLLWRAIQVNSPRQLTALRSACGADAALADYARILHVWTPVGADASTAAPQLYDIFKLLHALPRLAELHLGRPAPAPEFAMLCLPFFPQLTVLRICYACPVLVHTLLRALPTLRFVEVRGSSTTPATAGHAPDPPADPPPPRCRLYELRWGCGSHLHAPLALRASLDSLRILALHTLPPAPALSLPARLRSLRVLRYDPTLPDALRRCRTLEEFVMQDHVPPAPLLAALPRSLEHLALDCDDGNQRGLAAVAAWLRAAACPRLRVLTCFSPDIADTEWPEFVRACRAARVELRCFRGWHGLYENESEALGEVVRFPRAVPHHAQRILVIDP